MQELANLYPAHFTAKANANDIFLYSVPDAKDTRVANIDAYPLL